MDTNVVVSGMMAADPGSPPSRVLDAMLDGRLLYLVSGALISEYSGVMRRPGVVPFHQQTDDEIDKLLIDLAANAVWREPGDGEAAPEPGDNHLWALLASQPGSRLITGDQLLVKNPPRPGSVITPRDALDGLKNREDS